MRKLLLVVLILSCLTGMSQHPAFKVLVVASKAKDHLKMIAAARPFFAKLAADNNLSIDFTDDATAINDDNLKNYRVFVMLHLAPFDMTYSQQAAMQHFVEEGKGWVGVHAAGLTGKEFLDPQTTYWDWFEGFMGGVLYSPHPAYQHGTVIVQDRTHPATKNMPERFEMSDEWYEWDRSVRGNPDVRVLAVADESTYHQNKPMGDHPVVWTNTKFRRMIYLSIGHDPSSLENKDYATLLRDSILWAGS
ncbi:MAG TPA: ThuA domain-containing protein [Fimbriimonas sp.]|nr:ThuA domain-containing protein [Fimbriimonas sp.]